jgi:protocatechuate 3,4-dioxygenase beta subunit
MGGTGVGYNFSAVPAMLRGRVFYDQNLNGFWDAGEGGPSNVDVRLQNSDGSYSQTVQTSNGLFRFLNPPAGVYTLTELFNDPSVYDGPESIGAGGGYIAGNDVIAGIVFSGDVADAYGFAEVLPASLIGLVYEERGLSPRFQGYPDDDLPLTGITITLQGTDFTGAAVLTTTLTDYAGAWRFNALRPGVFTVTEAQPAGSIDGPELIGYGTTSATVIANDVYSVTLMPSDAGQAFDFVELPASLRGVVYDDRNDSGTRDAGDVGIQSVSVQAVGRTITGTLITQTVSTDSQGRYAFPALPAGTYTLTESQPSFYLDNDDAAGVQGGAVITNDVIAGIVYSPALFAGGYDFGELLPSVVNGFVYLDRNGNGSPDVGEPGLGGVALYLSGDTRRGGTYYTATTAANGAFSFLLARTGAYTLREAQPAGYADGADSGPNSWMAGVIGNDLVTSMALVPGGNLSYYYFGEQLAGIEGIVFVDSNMDGDSAGEVGLTGVPITLSGRSITGFAVLSGTLTDFQGRFTFRGLLTGTYTLTESQPTSYLGDALFDYLTIAGQSGGITTTRNVISGIVFTPTANASGYGFAELRPAQLSGIVGVDTNGDGQYGLTGATYSRVQTSAASSGVFSFITLPPGV